MDAFIGEIRAFTFSYVPVDWLPCNGQLALITQYQALCSILGLNFGGDGKTTFGIPNLNGVVAISTGTSTVTGINYPFASKGGTETVTLTNSNIPPHTHTFNGAFSSAPLVAEVTKPNANCYVANLVLNNGTPSGAAGRVYQHLSVSPPDKIVNLNPQTISPAFGNAQGFADAHTNLAPYLAITYAICWNGVYPPFNY